MICNPIPLRSESESGQADSVIRYGKEYPSIYFLQRDIHPGRVPMTDRIAYPFLRDAKKVLGRRRPVYYNRHMAFKPALYSEKFGRGEREFLQGTHEVVAAHLYGMERF